MKTAMRMLQLLLFTGGLFLAGKHVPTVSAQQGPWPTCIQAFSRNMNNVCASCCTASSWVWYIDGIIDSSPGTEALEDQYVDCGSTLPGGCGVACGVQDWPDMVSGACCLPTGSGPCTGLYSNDCCSGICDQFQGACVDCIPYGGFAYGPQDCCDEVWWNYQCW